MTATAPRPLDALPSFLATASWGAMFPIAAKALDHVDAFHLTAVRYLLATLVFVVLLALIEGGRALHPAGRGLELFALGTLGFAGFNLLSFVGLAYTEPQNASLIVATQPLLAVLGVWALTRRRPGRATLVAVAVALLGVALVITRGDPASALHGGLKGDLLIFAGAIGWVGYTLGARRFPELSPLRYTTLTAVGGTLTILVITEAATQLGWAATPSAAALGAIWWEIAYVVLFGAVLGVLAWNLGVRRLGAPNATLFMNLVPVVAFTIAVGGGYRPGAVELAGALLTVAALTGANLAGRRRAAALTPAAPAAARGGRPGAPGRRRRASPG
jgi:drug/metabolite transporter (DMT)-like permease